MSTRHSAPHWPASRSSVSYNQINEHEMKVLIRRGFTSPLARGPSPPPRDVSPWVPTFIPWANEQLARWVWSPSSASPRPVQRRAVRRGQLYSQLVNCCPRPPQYCHRAPHAPHAPHSPPAIVCVAAVSVTAACFLIGTHWEVSRTNYFFDNLLYVLIKFVWLLDC